MYISGSSIEMRIQRGNIWIDFQVRKISDYDRPCKLEGEINGWDADKAIDPILSSNIPHNFRGKVFEKVFVYPEYMNYLRSECTLVL